MGRPALGNLADTPDSGSHWVKSSLSFGNRNCVEVASLPDGEVDVRNSKDTDGPVLRFTTDEWHAFLAGVRNGEFDKFSGPVSVIMGPASGNNTRSKSNPRGYVAGNNEAAVPRRKSIVAAKRSNQLHPTRGDGRAGLERLRFRPAWLALGTIVALTAETSVDHYHPALQMVMLICDVGLPSLLTLVLVAVILFGSEERHNRGLRS